MVPPSRSAGQRSEPLDFLAQPPRPLRQSDILRRVCELAVGRCIAEGRVGSGNAVEIVEETTLEVAMVAPPAQTGSRLM